MVAVRILGRFAKIRMISILYIVFHLSVYQYIVQAQTLARRSRQEQRMCLGTFSRLRRSLATSTLSAAVRILAERFLLYRKTISCKAKKSHTTSSQYEIPIYFIIFFSIQYINSGITPFLPHKISAFPCGFISTTLSYTTKQCPCN